MEYGLIGEKLGHSFSKEIHNLIDSYSYELKEIAPDELDSFMKQKKFSGINVTIPYKKAVIPYLDEIEENAKKIGAVNTIVNRNGKLFGYNTDFYGMKALLEKTELDAAGKNVLILGTGGTSRTAEALMHFLGAKSICKISRNPEEVKPDEKGDTVSFISYKDALEKKETQIIINTTPTGMFPNVDEMPIALDAFSKLEGVIDVIYNPVNTQFVLQAKEKSLKASGGLYMLVMQALKAYELFFETQVPQNKCDEIFNTILNRKKNIVLVGMPSCGKTTVGKMLSQILSMDFVDTDEEIVKAQNRSIPEIFSEDGETVFRTIESAIVKKLSTKNSCIISTGGGVILKPENVEHLKMNGDIYFINRSLENLMPTQDRPVASSMQKLSELYKIRFPIYSKVSDFVINADDTPFNVVKKIIAAAKKETQINKDIVFVKPSCASGTVTVPPSKSFSHRALICACLADGKSIINNIEFSEDILATLDCIKSLGASYEINADSVTVYGIGNTLSKKDYAVFECRESGSSLRFFMPLSLNFCRKAEFSGSKVLLTRPLSEYEKIFLENDIIFERTETCIKVSGLLKPGKYELAGNISSQFVTGLLFVLPLLDGNSRIELIPPVESKPYIDLTIQMLKKFGISCEWQNENAIFIKGHQKYQAVDYTVEGDYSNAAFLDAFNTIGGRVEIRGLMENSLQGDRVYKQMFKQLVSGSPVLDITDCPDLGPVLFVLAALHNGAVFNGTKRLAIKESNRGKYMCDELAKFGIKSEQKENQIIIHKGKVNIPFQILKGYNDHRIVMALVTLLTVTGGMIDDAHAVKKSFPSYFEKIKQLNVELIWR